MFCISLSFSETCSSCEEHLVQLVLVIRFVHWDKFIIHQTTNHTQIDVQVFYRCRTFRSRSVFKVRQFRQYSATYLLDSERLLVAGWWLVVGGWWLSPCKLYTRHWHFTALISRRFTGGKTYTSCSNNTHLANWAIVALLDSIVKPVCWSTRFPVQ